MMKLILIFYMFFIVSCSNKENNGKLVISDANYIEHNLLDKVYGDYLHLKVLEKDDETGLINSGVGFIMTKMEDPGFLQASKLVFYKKENGQNSIILTYARYYSNRVNNNTLEANLIESMCVDKKNNTFDESFDLFSLDKTKYSMTSESDYDVWFDLNGFNLKYARFNKDSIISSFVEAGYELEFGYCNKDEINEQ